MNQGIIKIKGIHCQVDYLEDIEGDKEVYCHGDDDCGSCCGLGICDCGHKEIKKK